ncbi:MAG: SRPBCC family protein [Chlamydiales bacterium]|nr:SRPBCC family protein [Chlamydiales bacterium]
MFNWSHESSMEVDCSLQIAWDFFTNPSNWPKWEDRFDACVLDEELKAGSKIKVKFKNKPIQILILVAEVKPYHECKYLIKPPFFTQESLCTFQEISPEKTRITLKICIISFFVPFVKTILLKNVEKFYSKCARAFAEIAGKVS